MLKTPNQQYSMVAQTLIPSWHRPFQSGHVTLSLPIVWKSEFHKKRDNVGVRCVQTDSKAITTTTTTTTTTTISTTEQPISVKAIVTVQLTVGGFLSNLGLSHGLDDIADLLCKSIQLELVSTDLDPKTGLEKETIKKYAYKKERDGDEVTYESDIEVPADYGKIGAVIVENEHRNEMYLRKIVLDGFPLGPVNLDCNSWLESKFVYPQKRVFFTNKSYLPSETPNGLKRLREEDLVNLRGNGQGERKAFERIYDYDVYNDIGNPDKEGQVRPVLGGKDHPYPRRCRTGRPRSEKDPKSEIASSFVYVPRDESFSEVKFVTFAAKTLSSALPAIGTVLQSANIDSESEVRFPNFKAIDSLYEEDIYLPKRPNSSGFLNNVIPRLLEFITAVSEDVLRFEIPQMVKRDKFSWLKDEEFSRQTLAGLNPYSIRLVTEWPLKSKLDPKIYGPPESAISKDLIEQEIKDFMNFEEALEGKKLFILDYHDLFLPYVEKVRAIKGTTLYGSRTIFFLTPDGTLKPLAIELTRPPMNGKPQWKKVYVPSSYSTGYWLWRLAKAHVLAHDSGYHELVSHWLRTHCCAEPYIIASNRQLSTMHPIYRLLHPHFRYTMKINAFARQILINAGGIIETSFSPSKYSMELSSVAYDQQWRFDLQALPADLISRGLAVEDPSSPHGLKLMIEDYPFANDGLLLWDSIKEWVTDYVNHYYPKPELDDDELQAWWTEIKTVGHGDKKDEPWWPKLRTPQDLIGILTNMMWVTSAHHAAVNFGQYDFAGYFPNRPTIARTNMPDEDASTEQWNFFLQKPDVVLLQCFPSPTQATIVMAILEVLSNHSIDEEYIGKVAEPYYDEHPIINAAFERFNGRLKELEGIIDARNANADFKNRSGAGMAPYELLKPFSDPGVTGKGVPNSISI